MRPSRPCPCRACPLSTVTPTQPNPAYLSCLIFHLKARGKAAREDERSLSRGAHRLVALKLGPAADRSFTTICNSERRPGEIMTSRRLVPGLLEGERMRRRQHHAASCQGQFSGMPRTTPKAKKRLNSPSSILHRSPQPRAVTVARWRFCCLDERSRCS